MALPATIFRTNIQLSHVDRGIYETIQVTVAQHPSETSERMVARILAMAIFFEPGMSFTKGLCASDEPDLWILGPDGRPKLWGEVGLPDADRIVKASRHADQVALLACGRTLANWERLHLPKLLRIANLEVISLEPGFILSLVEGLERAIYWSITITDGSICLTSGDTYLETAIQAKMASASSRMV